MIAMIFQSLMLGVLKEKKECHYFSISGFIAY